MRPIDNKQLRRAVELKPLNDLHAEIASIPEGERSAFLDAHDSVCASIRSGLWTIGCMKCWYSEAELQEGEGHVEHYRPKKRLWGASHDGYWWKAFDWTNFRLAHTTVNLRRTDYLTRKKAGKGSYFPLRDPKTRATSLAGEANEEPVLLDPVVPADTRLLCFSESGAPCPRYNMEDNAWLHQRALDSIDYYHLNEGTWNAKREDLMGEVRALCEQLEVIAIAEPKDEKAYSQKIDEIFKYIGPFAQFSAACCQVVLERGLLECFGPAPS